MAASIYGRADRTIGLPLCDLTVAVHHRGAGRYTLAVWTGTGALVGQDESLTLPHEDHDRALRDGVGFLAAYASPEESGAFSDFWTPRVKAYADALDMASAELEEEEEEEEEEDRAPVVESLKLEKGAAGQIASVGTVRYPGETAKAFSFGGNVYGGPVAYTFQSEAPGAGGWMSGFVASPDRFGTFHEDPLEWTRRYFAAS